MTDERQIKITFTLSEGRATAIFAEPVGAAQGTLSAPLPPDGGEVTDSRGGRAARVSVDVQPDAGAAVSVAIATLNQASRLAGVAQRQGLRRVIVWALSALARASERGGA